MFYAPIGAEEKELLGLNSKGSPPMDKFITDYLISGRAWVLVGSGPSIQMGYPSWKELASQAISAVKVERPENSLTTLNTVLEKGDFARVFEEAKKILGGPRLLQVLEEKLTPSRRGEIYKLIARWPVPVYLTTNYDNEIQKHLADLGETYIPYTNSEDHLSYLLPELNGAIFKLHGDLRSETGLILSTSEYRAIAESDTWRYWRTKMTSVFQMSRLVVIGHSLSDRNIRHVLEAAKQGAGVLQPICWIAPDVSPEQRTEFLEKYRIRVISYDNRDGGHRNLLRLIESISDFIPPRTTIGIQENISQLSHSPLGSGAGAPGFFVFNKLAWRNDYDEKRIDVVIAAIQSAVPKLESLEQFTLQMALELAGWPKDFPLALDVSEKVRGQAVEQGLLTPVDNQFKVGDRAVSLAADNKSRFEHMRERFLESLRLRLKRTYPTLTYEEAVGIASDIEASLTGYFREGGLSLATTLFSTSEPKRISEVPRSIIKFITEASARYDDLLKRQAFCTASVDAFIRAGTAERDYLGRISQGFFAFHSLGAFGEVANERLRHAKETVWLIDSDAQIQAVALAAPTNVVFRDCFSRLCSAGIRLFTTENLFDETREHLWFANNEIRIYGPASPAVIAAAMGQAPYRKSNQFLQGFVRWQSAGNPCDWETYNFQIFGARKPTNKDIKQALGKLGIEVIALEGWPGFVDLDFQVRDEYIERIIGLLLGIEEIGNESQASHFREKARPEAEALVVVKREREGTYNILSNEGDGSPSWFISQTSILNAVEKGTRITWQPEAFLGFASTLAPAADPQAADQAFETLLWGLAQSGLSVLDEDIVVRVFGGVIDQATLQIAEQRQRYHETIEEKYGEPLESVLARVSPQNRPLAALQLANEMGEALEKTRHRAEGAADVERRRAELAERKLSEVERFRKKMEAKRAGGRRKAIKQKAKGRKKKKR